MLSDSKAASQEKRGEGCINVISCRYGMSLLLSHEEYPDLIEFDEIRLSADTKELYEKFGIKKQGYYFVRPDSHIAYRSASLDTQNFSTYLERFLVK